MTILALDPAGKIGWAKWGLGSSQIRSGVLDIRGRPIGMALSIYHDWLTDLLLAGGIRRIAREAPFVSEKTATSAPLLYGLAAITEESAWRFGRVPVSEVTPQQWRKFFLGTTKAPKTVAPHHRRQWIKDAAIDRCREIGLDPKDDNEADAIGILHYQRAVLFPEFSNAGELAL